jgi:multidrug efflux pump subunit AcrA (membrane-fusion protein)
MVNSAAWFALIGGVGGAAVGAGGAVLGPLMLHRRQAAERSEALLRQEERERAQQRREDELLDRQQQFELRVAERERATAAERERAAELVARQAAVTDRLKNMRSTTRAWQLLLRDTLEELWHGRPVDRGAFSEACRAARKAVNEAFDEALHDGLWFAHTGSAQTLMSHGSIMRAVTRNDHGVDVHALGQALSDATSAVTACVEAGCPLPEGLLRRANSRLSHLDLARESLNAYIVGRLAALGVEVERPHSA